jgi:3-oxoadipate enol-lactonase
VSSLDLLAFHEFGAGFPIVWIHGFPLSSAVFLPQTRIEGYRHLRPDLRGFGNTPPRRQMTMADYANDIVALLDHLRIDRTMVAGLSMGGYIVMELLRVMPERIAGLILMDTRETPDNEEARKNRYKSADEVEGRGVRTVIDSMLPKMVVSDSTKPLARSIMESASKEGIVAALKAMAERPDSTETVRAVRAPTLITVGEHDTITPVGDAQRMASLMGAELVIIPDAAHLANLEKPEEFNRSVEAFFREKVRAE